MFCVFCREEGTLKANYSTDNEENRLLETDAPDDGEANKPWMESFELCESSLRSGSLFCAYLHACTPVEDVIITAHRDVTSSGAVAASSITQDRRH